ncbi:MAG TPA: hypothetical protein VFG05_06745 [Methylocella sp.]|nr:hypothetical protein [Methylocella sp.]
MGPTHIDEYLALDGICFLVSALCSYGSIRRNKGTAARRSRLEQIAGFLFVFGFIAMTFISIHFAYELV